ncbi:MAG: glycosyltransferase family 2 protein [Candidatus Omnitrophica bacterium]|nr:glycosyltransferase family 2 protein [Candidatus Omnitrophota bacterium]
MAVQIKTNDPLVSVIIPTYNRSRVLPRTLSSLKRQTYKNLEVIVIDDASTDDTEKVVKSFERDLNLVYFKNKINLKIPARSRNIGLKKASGEYFALLDDDDEFLEKKIEIQLRTAQSLDEKAFILCNGFTIGKKSRYFVDIEKPSGFIPRGKGIFPARYKLPFPSSWFFHRELVDKIGYFDEDMFTYDDVDYSIRLMAEYPAYMVNQCLVNWHTSYPALSGLSMEHIEARKYFLKKHLDWIREDRFCLYKFYWSLGKDFKQLGRTTEAIQYFKKAFFVKPYKLEAAGKIVGLLCKDIVAKTKMQGVHKL